MCFLSHHGPWPHSLKEQSSKVFQKNNPQRSLLRCVYLFLTDPKFKIFQSWCFLSQRNVSSLHRAPGWDGHSSFPTAHTEINRCSRPWIEWCILCSQKSSLDHWKDNANTVQIAIVLYYLETNVGKNMSACSLQMPFKTPSEDAEPPVSISSSLCVMKKY